MRVVHEPDGAARTLASDAELAESFLRKTRGLMFREEPPAGYALVFRFEPSTAERLLSRVPLLSPSRRSIHMLFVRFPLDVLWIEDDRVTRAERLAPWRGLGAAPADTVIELPAGAAEGVSTGDTVVLADDPTG